MNVSLSDSLALAVVLVLFIGLHYLKRAGLGFAARTFVALGVGIVVGLIFRDSIAYITPIGAIYVQVITALVAPLIIVSILSSVTSLGDVARLRTLGLSSVFWLLLTNAIAIVLTLGVMLALGLGKGVNLDIDGVDPTLLTNLVTPFDQVLLGFFPSNIVGDIQSNKIIPIILFSLGLAVAYILVASKDEPSVRPFKDFIDALRKILFKAVAFVISVTPYAVLALVITTVSRAAGRLETVVALTSVLVVTVVISFISAYVVNGVLLRVWADVEPIAFFKKLTPAQYTAFTTQSSVGTLPLTIGSLTRKVGVSNEVANFTAPIGTTIGMPGCAGIWPIIVAVFSINVLGIEYGIGDYIILMILCALVSLGTAGVPGTAIITATAVLTAVGLPVEIMVLLVPISAVAGTASTMANVSAAATAAAIVARRLGQLDDDVFAGRKDPDDDAPVIGGGEPTQPSSQPAAVGPNAQPPFPGRHAGPLAVTHTARVPVGECQVD